MDRRQFLFGLSGGVASLALLKAVPVQAKGTTQLGERLYASSRQNGHKQNEAVIFSPERGDIRVVRLPGRAHDVTAHPFRNEVVAVARRPERFLVVFSSDPHKPALRLSSAKGRHFQGHGVFSRDGKLFFSAENDYEGERGVIGVRDVEKGYQQIAEFSSYGIGIHEINLHPDGKTLVVANGGILTHPDMGRAKLNLATMVSSLVYIDSKTGKLLEKRTFPKTLHQLSLRHFAITPKGQIVFGGQFQGSKQEKPPLVGFHNRGEDLQLVKAPRVIQHQLRNYIGSVAVDSSGTIAATSAPRGNKVAFWDLGQRRYMGQIDLADGCGLSATQKRGVFLISNGLGQVLTYDVLAGHKTALAYHNKSWHWDNHMLALTVGA